MDRIMGHLPGYYKGNTEMRAIANGGAALLDAVKAEAGRLADNQYIRTLTIEGVEYWEGKLEIVPDPSEGLDFRRERIFSRWTAQPPFTKTFLCEKLDGIIGRGRYELEIDCAAQTITAQSSAHDRQWYYEIRFLINRIKPCTMVFIDKPLLSAAVNISSEISYSEKEYNYRLGTAWRLGQKPFVTVTERGVVKLAASSSVKDGFLLNISAFMAGNVVKVVLNGSIIITAFVTKAADESRAVLEYTVLPSQTEEIRKIQLYDASGTLLDESNVYIPVKETAVIKQIFNVKEGV